MTRGILFIVWKGDTNAPDLLDRSIESVKQWHPELPVEVVRLPDGAGLLAKSRMLELSPFKSTLFLDADTVVLGNLNYGFEQAEKHGLACCICECPWARRYDGLRHMGDIVEFNTGVMFFTEESRLVFDRWQSLSDTLDSAHRFRSWRGVECMPLNDQAAFALAVSELDFNPYVLPQNWNFRHRWQKSVFGPIKIWHDVNDTPEDALAFNVRQMSEDAILQCALVDS